MDEKIARLNDWIRESQNIVFFGGAGVSTESGIPDFRSTGGLYNQQYKSARGDCEPHVLRGTARRVL